MEKRVFNYALNEWYNLYYCYISHRSFEEDSRSCFASFGDFESDGGAMLL